MLPEGFFQTDPLHCAESLIGTELVWGRCGGLVVETEAYLVEGDEACHTFMRPSTRAFVERNGPGTAYIYFNYGVHWMLNVLIKGGPRDGLILVRAIEPRRGLALMRKRRGVEELKRLCSGPGKLTQALEINKRHHEIDLCSDPAHSFHARGEEDVSVVADPRIGISRAKDFPWRFTLRDSPFISRPVKGGVLVSGGKQSSRSSVAR
ncbi:MAG: DNA-3-methyladenine glycosylase, partial [Spartobacteria bacterium]